MKVVKSLSIVNEYIEKLEQENKQLKKDLKDACYVIEQLKEDKKKAIEYIKEMPDEEKYCGLLYDNEEKRDLLEILGDKE